MAETAGPSWQRASYPLQAADKHAAPSGASTHQPTDHHRTIANPPIETAGSGSALPTKILPVVPVVPLSSPPLAKEAVNGLNKYSIMSQLGNDASFALRKSIDDILAGSETTTAVDRSNSGSSNHSYHYPSPSQTADTVSTAPQSPERRTSTSVPSRTWARGRYPLNAAPTEAVTYHDQSTTSIEQFPSASRTLRRAPGSGQLRDSAHETSDASNVQEALPSSASGASAPLHHVETDHSTGASLSAATGRWNRQVYPSQSASPSEPIAEAPEAWQKSERIVTDVRNPSLSETNGHSSASGTQACPMRHMNRIDTETTPQRPPRSLDDDRYTLETADPEAADGSQRGRGYIKSTFSRKMYPLQMPASHSNLRGSPTPPPSPPKQGQRGSQATSSSKKSRGTYPLNSSPSIAQMRASPSPPSSPDREQTSLHRPDPSSSAQQATLPRHKKALRRVAYPLQSPASMAELKPSSEVLPTLPVTISAGTDQEHTASTHDHPAPLKQSNASRRTRYPLQPASRPEPKLSTSLQPPPLESRTPTVTEIAPQSSDESVGTNNGSIRLPRQGYPLASQPSIPALEFSPPSPPAEESTNDVEEAKSSSSRKEELTTKVLNQWRRQIYPMQDPERPFQRALTPQSSNERMTRSPSPGPKFLPKNIRAVKDSTTQQSGGRTIVVCLDGTGDKFDNDNSNIIHLVSALKKDDASQVSYYQAGIGTYNEGGLNTGFSAAMDMAVGSELGLHVRDAYQFLMHSYKEGDKICILGFSRGAYTARCLAGMVHKVGLLPPRNLQQIYFAYQFYADDSKEGWKASSDFKATFSIDVSIYFMGVFDSVASVGIIPRQLPLSTTPSNKCAYFRHAMALDERRAKFKVCRFQTVDWDDLAIDESPEETPAEVPPWHPPHEKYGPKYHPNVTDEEYERLAEPNEVYDTDVNEVWFAGCHADIGGGAVPNSERHKLAQIPLRWMIRQTFECNTGIRFKTKKLAEFGIDVHTLWPKYRALNTPTHGPPPSFLEKYEKGLPPRSVRRGKLVPTEHYEQGERLYHLQSHTDEDWTPEQVEDFYDAMAPMNDQLVQAPHWWILELWPVQYKVPIANGQVELRTGMNLGRYRGVGDVEPNLHWTVLHRVQHLDYRILVRTAPHTKWRIVV